MENDVNSVTIRELRHEEATVARDIVVDGLYRAQCQGGRSAAYKGNIPCNSYSPTKTEGEWNRKDKIFAKDNREACFVLHLSRAPLFHIATTVGPCIILVVLMSMTFIIPLDKGDRISFGVTILLSMVVSLVFVTDVLPVKGSLPFFATLIITCMGLMGLFLFFTLVIIVIHDREGSLSPAAKTIFLRYIARMLLLGDLTANKQANDEEVDVINHAAIELTNCAYETDNVSEADEEVIYFGGHERSEQPSTPTEDASGSSGLSELNASVKELITVVREVGDLTNAEIRELTKAVKNEEEVSDYILLAKVLDRLCLVLYFISIAATVPMTMYLSK
ncbi:PREDICTED: neuronal acetylcholine receptor subunit alpha-7-like [Branchiostoma belcheri]|uniref:Neuronal acetylcholine receptor subunit alpha-7-like n=1 Tax=Branchiostoma belcheri TaxID=7741 RepID=A0A6P4ZSQ7_BRABE|nr:PREDICTED: neuronal acetylcholine receptor subunit alpha-7-like [Branchiostoma belcheri]